jgi:uncharacterized protein
VKGNGHNHKGLRIAITGATGMIGRQLTSAYGTNGNRLTLFARKPFQTDKAHEISIWNPDQRLIDVADLEGQDVFIHLAGKNIAAVHWSESHKRGVLESRVRSTELLCKTLIQLKQPPKVLLSASAIGFYGNRSAEEEVDETSAVGDGFMADVCRQWEAATKVAEAAGIRVVNLRTGLVMSPDGGTLAKLLPLFRLGLGGKIGSGEQVMSWIALEEIPPVLLHIVQQPNLSGPINLVSPNPVTNATFVKLLAKVLTRPAFFGLPAFGAKLAFGEMAEELLLSGARIIPRKLLESGYQFNFPELEDTFRQLLIKTA